MLTNTFFFIGNAGIWVQTHVIYYRPLKEDTSSSTKTGSSGASSNHSSRKGKGSSSKSTSKRKGDDLWNGNNFFKNKIELI